MVSRVSRGSQSEIERPSGGDGARRTAAVDSWALLRVNRGEAIRYYRLSKPKCAVAMHRGHCDVGETFAAEKPGR